MSSRTIMKALSEVPILVRLNDSEKKLVADNMVSLRYRNGVDIITQGEEGKGFFIIEDGKVKVSQKDENGVSSLVATLGTGDYFGEAALINKAVRGATVTAHGVVKCLYLDRKSFNHLFSKSRLNVQFVKRKGISAETTNETGTFKAPPANAVTQKDAKTMTLLRRAVQSNILFLDLSPDHTLKILSEMYRREVKKGVNIITQGEVGDNLYIVESGDFDIFVGSRRVTHRGAGTYFGELALLYNSPRAATVKASVDSVVWCIDRFTFRRIVNNLSRTQLNEYTEFLQKCDVLSALASYERQKLAEALDEVQVENGKVIFQQGERGDAMYIVRAGEVRITKLDSGDTKAREVCVLKAGQYFGERALLTSEPRAATVRATKPTVLLKLDASSFSLLLGPLEDIMNGKMEAYSVPSIELERKLKISSPSSHAEAEEDDSYANLAFDDLKVIGTLGSGSFGHVQLVQDRKSDTMFALKAVSKAHVVSLGQEEHIVSEKRVMERLRHPFLVRLFRTYQDRDSLYFLLEPVMGGELFSLLRRRTLFREPTARFYAASTILAFEYMHSLGIVYRDLKPENMLLDEQGFLRITDFGFAKDIGNGSTYTLCGTPDYLAPEIIQGQTHGKGVDWWTTGILIYEMLASYPPFTDNDDPMRTYANIIAGHINYAEHISLAARNLIGKLLHRRPSRRLGVTKGGAELIKSHVWFRELRWSQLIAKKVKTPYVPVIDNKFDLSNFEDAEPLLDPIQPFVDDGSNWSAEF